ncbi:hypothetical protein EYF80_053665 [Liparis tanakae]|uniref:Uncharacterized protein n=1 Tax=Liparis tanakae TaxID=230148 RepID=A0A4Z2F4Z0_9TELE|nr:hypothetical protein EYF80_053665 [Liparis tanakae]
MVISASSHCTLAEALPSLATPSSVACLPVCLCTQRPPTRSPASAPPITASTGHTSAHSVLRWCSGSSARPCCRPWRPRSSSGLAAVSWLSRWASCSSRLCTERLFFSLWPPPPPPASLKHGLILCSRSVMVALMRCVQWSARCSTRISCVVASASTVATGLQTGSPGRRSRGEMVLASMSSTQVMKSPCVKLLSVSVCSPLWYRLPLYARYSHMSDVVRWLKSCTGHRDTPTHVPSLPRFSFTM